MLPIKVNSNSKQAGQKLYQTLLIFQSHRFCQSGTKLQTLTTPTGEQEKTGNIPPLLESMELHKYISMEFLWMNIQAVFQTGKTYLSLYMPPNLLKKNLKSLFKFEIYS